MAFGSRVAISASAWGRITAFVAACGVARLRTIVWQTMWWTPVPTRPKA